MKTVLGSISRFLRQQAQTVPTDGQLLEAYLARREETAFAALVRRHGPMVWGVCRRILTQTQDAEDAYQATFLILVRKAAAVWPREQVAAWLHGVAVRTAWHARTLAAKRRRRETLVPQVPEVSRTTTEAASDLRHLLDQELQTLPAKYRVLLVLCDLEGHTRREAAAHLGCPEGTVAGRLVRARAMLARRLARHGPLLSTSAVAVLLAKEAAAVGLPPLAAHQTLPHSATIILLTEGVLRTMSLTKLATVTTLLLGTCAALFCVGLPKAPALANIGTTVQAATREQPTLQQHLQEMPWYVVNFRPDHHLILSDTPLPHHGLDEPGLVADPYGRIHLSTLPVAPSAKVTLDGKPAQATELRPGMRVRVRFAEKETTLVAIDAVRPLPQAMVIAVDATRNTITVALGSERILKDIPLAKDLHVTVYPQNKAFPLQQVRPGMRATLKFRPENGQLAVVEMTVRE